MGAREFKFDNATSLPEVTKFCWNLSSVLPVKWVVDQLGGSKVERKQGDQYEVKGGNKELLNENGYKTCESHGDAVGCGMSFVWADQPRLADDFEKTFFLTTPEFEAKNNAVKVQVYVEESAKVMKAVKAVANKIPPQSSSSSTSCEPEAGS